MQLHHNLTRGVLIAVADVIEPLIQIERTEHTTLQGDIGGFVQTRDFSHAVFGFVAIAVFGNRDLHADTTDLLKTCRRTAGLSIAKVHQKVKLHIGFFAQHSHECLLVLAFAAREFRYLFELELGASRDV